MMTQFLIVAGLLALVACAIVVVPLMLGRGGQPRALGAALLIAVTVLGGSFLLYGAWSGYSFRPAGNDGTPAAMVGQLVRRLDRNPNDLEGWLMLGRSYVVMEQYPLAIRAYQRADRVAEGKSADALTGLAEALILGKQSDLDGRAGRLFEQALALQPRSTKALFYSAIAALERGEKDLARGRFQTLLAGNPPPEVRTLIERTLQGMDAPAGADAPAPAPVAAAQGPASAKVVEVAVRVTLSPKVAASVVAGAPLFVLARVPGVRGPPLAARKLEARFPQNVVLKSTDAMLGGSGFAAGQRLEITARVGNGGGAIARSGDPFGSVEVTAGSKGVTAIEIAQLTP